VIVSADSSSPSDTLALGRALAQQLRPGDIVLLSGRLGCGKTLFASGVAEGLGAQEQVTSPSFVIVHTYEGFLPIVHADVYRLGSTGEFDDLELPEAARDGVLLIEWGNAVTSVLPPDYLIVEITITGEQERTVRFVPVGAWESRSLGEFES
jgi:tRNA threonylcarbamoyladenosine biosynthesis protein TsaE